jgi:hypothetical protein
MELKLIGSMFHQYFTYTEIENQLNLIENQLLTPTKISHPSWPSRAMLWVYPADSGKALREVSRRARSPLCISRDASVRVSSNR